MGVFARTVNDAALLAGFNGRTASPAVLSAVGPTRIGICKTSEWSQTAPETLAALELAASALAGYGCAVEEIPLLPIYSELTAAQVDSMAAEAAHCLDWEKRRRPELISLQLLELREAGADLSKTRDEQALTQVRQGPELLGQIFVNVELLLAPSTIGEALLGLTCTGNPVFSRMWTALHVPEIHLPFMKGRNGLPVGVQCIAPLHANGRLLRYAKWIRGILNQA